MSSTYERSADKQSGVPSAISQQKPSLGQRMADHRPEAAAQAKMSEMMQQKSSEPLQRAGEEEEMMQGKFVSQRAPEEEEMTQG